MGSSYSCLIHTLIQQRLLPIAYTRLTASEARKQLKLLGYKEPVRGYQRIKGNIQLNEIAYKLECNAEAIEIIKSLEADAIILEPTGYWYASFWVNCAKKLGLNIYWISHQQTKINRQHYFKTKNKDDYLDALTIALTYLDKSGLDDLGNPPILRNYDVLFM